MEPVAIRLGADQLRSLLDGWKHPEIALRPVQTQEAEAAAQLILEASREIRTPTDAAIRGTTATCAAAVASGSLLMFVEHRGKPAGVLRGELYPAAAERRVFYISYIAIQPQLRSAGLGSLLMGHLEGWAGGMGADAMTLDFMAENRRVEPFYRRLGYEVVGYDLLEKLLKNDSSEGGGRPRGISLAPGVRSYEPVDLAQVLVFLRGRQGLSTFEEPFWTESELAARLQALGTEPQQRLFLATREGVLVGLCWSLWRLSKSGAPIVIATCFESDELETAAVLLDTLDGLAREHAAVESYVTLWEPCGGTLELALTRGYTFGRYKLRKQIPAEHRDGDGQRGCQVAGIAARPTTRRTA